MKQLLTIIGARPQIIKAAALSRAIETHFGGEIKETILHTGQHYDERMSQVFFSELGIPEPDIRLSTGGGAHGAQTAAMLEGIEKALQSGHFDGVVVYGDTNSTLAGALAAVKLHVPVVHIEAGLRSFNKSMPEEINRITCDHCSTLLFSPTKTGVTNLVKEGFSATLPERCTLDSPGVFHCGDVMYDNSLYFAELAETKYSKSDLGLKGDFALVTIHRPYNADHPDRMLAILEDLLWLHNERGLEIVLPMHPRTRKQLEEHSESFFSSFCSTQGIHVLEPVSFLEMTFMEKHAKLIVTDSGGVQKEAFFFQTPSVVIRTETEWVELLENGAARLCFETGAAMRTAFDEGLAWSATEEGGSVFGDGAASRFICEQILAHL
jgi:UDP-GlcNAc3NAcA epimerase